MKMVGMTYKCSLIHGKEGWLKPFKTITRDRDAVGAIFQEFFSVNMNMSSNAREE